MLEEHATPLDSVLDSLLCLTWDQSNAVASSEIFAKLVQALELRKEELVVAELRDTGKTQEAAANEILVLVEHFKYALQLMKSQRRELGSAEVSGCATRLFPIGNIALILPYNFPAVVLAERLPYMLAAGNSVCVKPSEVAEGSVAIIVDTIRQILGSYRCALMRGGGDIGMELVRDRRIDFVSFTGSTRVGKSVAVACAERFKRFSLELGGLNFAVIHLEDDFHSAIRHCVNAITYHSGQCCISLRRIIVPKGSGKKFESLLKSALHKHLQSNPMKALLKRDEFDQYVVQFDAPLAAIEHGSSEEKIFLVDSSHFTDNSEVFGPLVGISEFETEIDIIKQVNEVDYGLSLQLFSVDYDWVDRLIDSLSVGRVWVNDSLRNTPELRIGGFKSSGNSWIGGENALLDYVSSKAIVYGSRSGSD